MAYQEIRSPDGHLLARIDAERLVLELQRKKERHLIDLSPYLWGTQPAPAVQEPPQPAT